VPTFGIRRQGVAALRRGIEISANIVGRHPHADIGLCQRSAFGRRQGVAALRRGIEMSANIVGRHPHADIELCQRSVFGGKGLPPYVAALKYRQTS